MSSGAHFRLLSKLLDGYGQDEGTTWNHRFWTAAQCGAAAHNRFTHLRTWFFRDACFIFLLTFLRNAVAAKPRFVEVLKESGLENSKASW